MVLREISRLDVETVLATAHRTAVHAHGATGHAGTTLDGRGIVVVTETEDHDRVITVMIEEEH